MTPIAWSMLILGFGLGFGITSIVAIRTIREQMKWLNDSRKMLDSVKDLSIDQLESLSAYVDRRLESFMNYLMGLTDIDKQICEHNKEFRDQVAKVVDNINAKVSTIGNEIHALNNVIEEQTEVNDDRWFLLKDYMMDDDDDEPVNSSWLDDTLDFQRKQLNWDRIDPKDVSSIDFQDYVIQGMINNEQIKEED